MERGGNVVSYADEESIHFVNEREYRHRQAASQQKRVLLDVVNATEVIM
jgi:hypothetical protein